MSVIKRNRCWTSWSGDEMWTWKDPYIFLANSATLEHTDFVVKLLLLVSYVDFCVRNCANRPQISSELWRARNA